MRFLVSSLGILTTMIGAAQVEGAPVQWSPPEGNGHYYEAFVVEGGISWDDASQAAANLGGHLATSTSQDENQFIFELVNSPEYWHPDGSAPWLWWGPWLGGFQPPGSPEPAGDWQWVTGEPFEYTNWLPGEPNNAGVTGDENAICLHSVFESPGPGWNDENGPLSVPVAYVVESIPEPSTLLLVATAVLCMLAWTWRRRVRWKWLAALTAVVVLLVDIVPAKGEVIFCDDFNDGVFDLDFWDVQKSDGINYEETGGVLKITAANQPVWLTMTCKPSLPGLGGWVDAQIDFNWLYCDDHKARFQLQLKDENGTGAVMNFVRHREWGFGRLMTTLILHPNILGTSQDGPYIEDLPLSGRLRLRREEDTFSGYYWRDGDWRLLGTIQHDAFADAALIPRLYTSNSSRDPGYEVHLDNFCVSADRIVPEPSTFALLTIGVMALLACRVRCHGRRVT